MSQTSSGETASARASASARVSSSARARKSSKSIHARCSDVAAVDRYADDGRQSRVLDASRSCGVAVGAEERARDHQRGGLGALEHVERLGRPCSGC